jgi:hypothetical protein
MTDAQAMMGAAAVIAVCLAFVVRAILAYKGKTELVGKFDHYKPFAVMAAKRVEKQVPDDFGKGAEDPAYAKAAHKLDLFLKKFVEVVEKVDGTSPNDDLKKEAMKWSVELARRVKDKK